jgi:hypothetical protein
MNRNTVFCILGCSEANANEWSMRIRGVVALGEEKARACEECWSGLECWNLKMIAFAGEFGEILLRSRGTL